MIPLTMIFYEGLQGATGTMFRLHRVSQRIVPHKTTQAALSNPSLGNLTMEDALVRTVPPRFDPTLTPLIVQALNEAQSFYLARGILNIIALRTMNPLAGGGPIRAVAGRTAAGAGARVVAAAAARNVLTNSEAITVEATLARNILPATGKLAQVLRGIQARFVAAHPGSILEGLSVLQKATSEVGLEVGIVQSGNITSEIMVIQNVGNVTTTILRSGEIVVRLGETVILRLIP